MHITLTLAALLCFILRPLSVNGTGNSSIGDVSNNYWGGADPCTATGTQPGAMSWDGTHTNSNGIFFNCAGGSTLTGWQHHSFSVDCGGKYTTSAPTPPTRVEMSRQDLDSCQKWKQWESIKPSTEDESQQQFDTLKRYIESCAASDNDSYAAFTYLVGANSEIHLDDSTRWNTFREWLISVLFLNKTNPEYFCACLQAMIGTYGVEPYRISNAGMAIMKYLIEDSNCYSPGLVLQYQMDSASRYTQWIRNGAIPGQLDTTLPSLDTLGLGFLLTRRAIESGQNLSGIGLVDCSGSPNPFLNETELSFTLNRMTYVTVSIYDPLGRMVWGDGKGHSLDAGTHTIRIDGASLPSGTLYARISTGFGEVKTVKLVHQE